MNAVRSGLLWAMFNHVGRHQLRGRSETDGRAEGRIVRICSAANATVASKSKVRYPFTAVETWKSSTLVCYSNTNPCVCHNIGRPRHMHCLFIPESPIGARQIQTACSQVSAVRSGRLRLNCGSVEILRMTCADQASALRVHCVQADNPVCPDAVENMSLTRLNADTSASNASATLS